MNFTAPSQPALPQLPNAPPPPPVFAQAPAGQKPGRKSSTPSFLNAAALPASGGTGSKELVGQ